MQIILNGDVTILGIVGKCLFLFMFLAFWIGLVWLIKDEIEYGGKK